MKNPCEECLTNQQIMSIGLALIRASAGGSVQLLILCAGGALLARKGVLDKSACSSWSRGMLYLHLVANLLSQCIVLSSKFDLTILFYFGFKLAIFNLFLPSLLFSSILQTVYNAKEELQHSSWDSFQVLIPGIWALVTLLASSLVADAVVSSFTRHIEDPVKRILFISLLLGNANNLPILLINKYGDTQFHTSCSSQPQVLTETLTPFLQLSIFAVFAKTMGHCGIKATARSEERGM